MHPHYLSNAASLLLMASLVTACSKPPEQNTSKPKGPDPIPVTVIPVKSMELQRKVRVVGSLVGLETAVISNRVTGTVSKIYVERGAHVTPGQKLLEIEPDRFQMGVQDAQGALQQTLARLGIKEIPGDDFDINITAPVKKAQSEYDNAKAKLNRAKPLHDSRAMNDFEFLDIESAEKSALSALENSRDEARALLAQARQNRTQVEMRNKDFKDSVIVAPDGNTPDGHKVTSYAVTERRISTGEYLREGTSLFTLVADDTLKLQTKVPERFLADVKDGASISFRVEAYPTETFEGTVEIIDPSVDPVNLTFRTEALVDNKRYQNRLRPGFFVSGDLLTKKEPNRIMIPVSALTSFVGVNKIFKLDPKNPGKVRAITVETDQQQSITDASGKTAQWVEISKTLDGELTPTDQVVVSGLTKLVDNSPVTVQTPAAPTPAATNTSPTNIEATNR